MNTTGIQADPPISPATCQAARSTPHHRRGTLARVTTDRMPGNRRPWPAKSVPGRSDPGPSAPGLSEPASDEAERSAPELADPDQAVDPGQTLNPDSALRWPPEGGAGAGGQATGNLQPGISVCLDADGWITWVSPAATQVMGWSAAWVAGRTITSLIHPDDRAAVPPGGIPGAWASQSVGPRRYRASDGSFHRMSAATTNRNATGGSGELSGTLVTFSSPLPEPPPERGSGVGAAERRSGTDRRRLPGC